MSATPCMVLVINKVIFNDDISKNNYLGVLLSTLGVIYLILKGDVTNMEAFNKLNQGDLWTMGSAVSWAFYCSFLRKKDKNISGNAFVAVSSLIGTIILLPVLVIYIFTQSSIDFSSYQHPGFFGGAGLPYFFPFMVIICFLESWHCGYWCNPWRDIHTYYSPVRRILSIVFLGTKPESFHLVSTAIIITGIWLCSKKKRG